MLPSPLVMGPPEAHLNARAALSIFRSIASVVAASPGCHLALPALLPLGGVGLPFPIDGMGLTVTRSAKCTRLPLPFRSSWTTSMTSYSSWPVSSTYSQSSIQLWTYDYTESNVGAVSARPSTQRVFSVSQCRWMTSAARCFVSKSAGLFPPRTFR